MKPDSALSQPESAAVASPEHFMPWLRWLSGGNLLLVVAAELLIAFVSAQWGLILYVILLSGLALYRAATPVVSEQKLALTLLLVPLIRISALAMPLIELPPATWPVMIGVPVLIAVVLVSRRLNLSRHDLGLTSGNLLLQVMIGAAGPGLGIAAALFLRDTPLLHTFSWNTLWWPILFLILGSAWLEELIFRGIIQSTALAVLHRWALVYSALLFAALQIGQLSLSYLCFAFGTGLLFAYIVRWSGSILGVSLAHGMANITLLIDIPYFKQTQLFGITMPWIVACGAVLAFIACSMLLYRASTRNNKTQPALISTDNLRTQRLQSGLIYSDLALKTGIPARQIAEIEYGLCQPQPEQVQRLAVALGITSEEQRLC